MRDRIRRKGNYPIGPEFAVQIGPEFIDSFPIRSAFTAVPCGPSRSVASSDLNLSILSRFGSDSSAGFADQIDEFPPEQASA
ncbi:hypothetical protein NL676_009324 [Syzygium grande]|nr:hypothetical protein NL676_009324 [Syzygium grande]